jgi:hypothetical protein
MGWSFLSSCSNKAAIIKHLTEECGVKTIAKCVKGNVLWAVQESTTGTKFIGCYLLGADQGWWGYKDMDESCGPCYYNCPLAYLEMVEDPKSTYSTGWREKVKAFHAKNATFNGMKPGTKVKLKDGLTIQGEPITEAIIESVRPLRATVLAGSTFPRTVSLSKRHIDAII